VTDERVWTGTATQAEALRQIRRYADASPDGWAVVAEVVDETTLRQLESKMLVDVTDDRGRVRPRRD
jgi:hypothetical protein